MYYADKWLFTRAICQIDTSCFCLVFLIINRLHFLCTFRYCTCKNHHRPSLLPQFAHLLFCFSDSLQSPTNEIIWEPISRSVREAASLYLNPRVAPRSYCRRATSKPNLEMTRSLEFNYISMSRTSGRKRFLFINAGLHEVNINWIFVKISRCAPFTRFAYAVLWPMFKLSS